MTKASEIRSARVAQPESTPAAGKLMEACWYRETAEKHPAIQEIFAVVREGARAAAQVGKLNFIVAIGEYKDYHIETALLLLRERYGFKVYTHDSKSGEKQSWEVIA